MEHSPRNSDPNRKYHKVLLLVDYKDLRVILETLDETEKGIGFPDRQESNFKDKITKVCFP
jgi:hypothetical protein